MRNLKSLCILFVMAAGIGLFSQAGDGSAAYAQQTDFRYLAADPSLRAGLSGATVRMDQATYVGKVLELEETWEDPFYMGYPGTVVTDPASGRLRMYYEVMTLLAERFLALAESDDGINWTKPELNITGNRYTSDPLNNFIDYQDRTWVIHPNVFVDPNAPPQERYKISYLNPGPVLTLGASADGLHFHDVGIADDPGSPSEYKLDSQNVTFWDPRTQQYQAHMRWRDPASSIPRGVYTKCSATWEGTWLGPREVTIDPDRDSVPEVYTPGVMPYHGQYIGLPSMFYTQTNDSLYPTFMYSRDSSQWHFEDPYHPVIDLGAHGQTTETFGMAKAAPSLVERDGKLWIYYTYASNKHTMPPPDAPASGYTINLATIRQDGFVAIESEPGQLGTWTTSAIELPQEPVYLTINALVTGSLGVEVLDPDTLAPLPGYSAVEAVSIGPGDYYLDVAASWQDADSLSALVGQEVVLRFALDDASIYSFSFALVPDPATLPGDINGDGLVGGADMVRLITNWGLTGATYSQGDIDGSGTVDAGDYNAILNSWGDTLPPEPPSGAPEPATLGLLLMGGLVSLLRLRRA